MAFIKPAYTNDNRATPRRVLNAHEVVRFAHYINRKPGSTPNSQMQFSIGRDLIKRLGWTEKMRLDILHGVGVDAGCFQIRPASSEVYYTVTLRLSRKRNGHSLSDKRSVAIRSSVIPSWINPSKTVAINECDGWLIEQGVLTVRLAASNIDRVDLTPSANDNHNFARRGAALEAGGE